MIGTFNRSLLSPNFFKDSARLELFIEGGRLASKDGSYRGTAQLYRLLGLTGSEAFAGACGFALFVTLTVLVAYQVGYAAGGVVDVVLYCLLPIVAGVFLFMYTKELFVVALFVALVSLPKNIAAEALFVALMIGYAAAVRPYWFIVAALYIGFRALSRWPRWVPLGVPIACAALVAIFNVVLDVPVNHYRTSVLEDISVFPASAISDPVSGDGLVAQFVNSLHAVVVLQFPYPLIAGGSVTHLGAGFVIAATWALFWWRSQYWRGDCCASTSCVRVARYAAISLAYLVTLSLFEPDFGSYLRHLLPALPIVLGFARLVGGQRGTSNLACNRGGSSWDADGHSGVVAGSSSSRG
ncbi:hypothetical protein ACI8AG_10460 [Blastococcus sp. SYSU DS0552]